jgi:antirestriction protein ArdC
MNQEANTTAHIIVQADLLRAFEEAVERAGEHGTAEAYKAMYQAALAVVHNYKEHETYPPVFVVSR